MRLPGENIILATDSYKQTHWKMYPPKTQQVGSYLEARKGGEYKETVFFGLQYILERYFSGIRVTRRKIDEAEIFCKEHFGQDLFNKKGWEYILNNYAGKLPVEIEAVPEGTAVSESNVLLTITNTDPNCFWLVNHLETLLVQLWYPCTVATISREQKKILKDALELTGSIEKLPFMLHDFGYRGSTSVESASIGDAAHLVNFVGTDTIAGIEFLKEFYDGGMTGFSVPAAEHSTITSWGEHAEEESYKHILDQYESGIVSVVSDSWNIYNACQNIWGGNFAERIIEEGGKRTLVIRPDSGNPEEVIPNCLNILGGRFGYLTNKKGYKVLPSCIRLIQGDGISRESLPGLIDSIIKSGWSLDNIVFGSGGGLIQDCNRDTLRFAMKCSWVDVGGRITEVYKKPATDASKNSKKGKIKLIKTKLGYKTVPGYCLEKNELATVFKNGELLNKTNIDAIRKRSEI